MIPDDSIMIPYINIYSIYIGILDHIGYIICCDDICSDYIAFASCRYARIRWQTYWIIPSFLNFMTGCHHWFGAENRSNRIHDPVLNQDWLGWCWMVFVFGAHGMMIDVWIFMWFFLRFLAIERRLPGLVNIQKMLLKLYGPVKS